jgi:very-short-patch-repair endonuclease
MSKSEAERDLLQELRWLKKPEPTPEFQFHPTRKWRFDLAWPEQKIAVEVEGGAFTGGRHTRGDGFTKDCEKHNAAALMGWLLLRVTPAHIRDGQAIDWIEEAFRAHPA